MTHAVGPLDVQGHGPFEAVRQADYINSRVVTADGSSHEEFQAPTKAKYVLFTANGEFYLRITPAAAGAAVVAAIPAADVTDGSAPECVPAGHPGLMRMLPDDTAYISVVSPTSGATVITAQFFSI